MKNNTVASKLIISFFLLSFTTVLSWFVFYNIYVRSISLPVVLGNFSLFGLRAFFSYFDTLPYVAGISVYYAFSSYFSTINHEGISRVVTKPLAVISSIVLFYIFISFFISPYIISTLKRYTRDLYSIEYKNYKNNLKNEAFNNAKIALDNNDIKKAYSFAAEALHNMPNDFEIINLMKEIKQAKTDYLFTNQSSLQSKIESNLTNGVKEFSHKNYDTAMKYFREVLKFDEDNGLALFYINKISINQKNAGAIYKGKTASDVKIYDSLSKAITYLNEKNYWSAYNIIYDLYAKYPTEIEVRNYNSIISDAINKNDFFISDSIAIKVAFLDKNKQLQTGFNILLNDDRLMHIGSSLFFMDSFYIFDVIIVSLKDSSYSMYKYGKLLPISDDRKELILKGRFDFNTKTHNSDDYVSTRGIFINVSDDTINMLRDKDNTYLQYKSFRNILNWHNELSSIGYSTKASNYGILYKLISPMYFAFLLLILAYYSLRFRISLTAQFHIYHRVIGIVGTFLLIYFSNSLFLILVQSFSILSNLFISTISLFTIFLILILFYTLQLARINVND